MGEVLRGSLENTEGLVGGKSAPQESTAGVIRVRVGEDFEPFRALIALPKYDPEQGIDQDMFNVAIELNGIPGTLTLFPDVEEGKEEVKNPTLSVEAVFKIRTLYDFKVLDGIRLRLDANRNIRYVDTGKAESESTVKSKLTQGPIVEISASRLRTREGRQAKNFAPRPKSLRKIRARFIPA